MRGSSRTRSRTGSVVLAALAMLVSCSRSGPELRWPSDSGGAGAGIDHTTPDKPYTFGSVLVCRTAGPGTVWITAVAPIAPSHGLAVTGFATRPNPYDNGGEGFGEAQKPVSSVIPHRQTSVTGVCGAPGSGVTPSATELLVEYTKPADTTASDRGLLVSYKTSVGTKGTLGIPFTVALCAPVTGDECNTLAPLTK